MDNHEETDVSTLLTFETQINDLSDELLSRIFQYLDLKEKLSVERVCKQWQRNVLKISEKHTGLGITWTNDNYENCLAANQEHCVSMGDIRAAIPMSHGTLYNLTTEHAISNLKSISQKCPNVGCLHISHAIINSNSIEQIVSLFPNLECLHFRNNLLDIIMVDTDMTDDERQSYCIQISVEINEQWSAIGTILGPVIKHLNINPNSEYRMSETNLINFIKHFPHLTELRVGRGCDNNVRGHFLAFLPKECKLFYNLGYEHLAHSSLVILVNNNRQSLTHLSYFCTPQSLNLIANSFENLIALKIFLTNEFNDFKDLTTASPITQLRQLNELSVDLCFLTNTEDKVLNWLLKDPIPWVHSLEIKNSVLSRPTFITIAANMAQLRKLKLTEIEFQCSCSLYSHIQDKNIRNNCKECKENIWDTLSGLWNLEEIILSAYYSRWQEQKCFPLELCPRLSTLGKLRRMTICQYDIKLCFDSILEALNQLMKETETKDFFILKVDCAGAYLTALQNVPEYLRSGKLIPFETFLAQQSINQNNILGTFEGTLLRGYCYESIKRTLILEMENLLLSNYEINAKEEILNDYNRLMDLLNEWHIRTRIPIRTVETLPTFNDLLIEYSLFDISTHLGVTMPTIDGFLGLRQLIIDFRRIKNEVKEGRIKMFQDGPPGHIFHIDYKIEILGKISDVVCNIFRYKLYCIKLNPANTETESEAETTETDTDMADSEGSLTET